MNDSSAPPLRLTATLVAQYFRFRCDRQLRYDLVPEAQRHGDIPVRNADPEQGPLVGPRPGAGLLNRAGRAWERRKLRQLVERFGEPKVRLAGWTERGEPRTLRFPDVVEILRDPGDAELLVQPELSLPEPEVFAARFGLPQDLVRIAPARPDLIRIQRSRDGAVRFQVADIKASREATAAHRAQVAFYTLLLEEILRSAEIPGATLDLQFGRIWSRNGKGAERFPLGVYRHHVSRFLSEVLPRIAGREPGACGWHLAPSCNGCNYFHHCRSEADESEDLARVPGLTPLSRTVLHQRGIRTVKDLITKQRRDTYTGCHTLEANATRLQKRAQAIQWNKLLDLDSRTHLMSPSEDVRVIVTAEGDPVTGCCFALGVRVEGKAVGAGAERREEVYLASAGTHRAEAGMLQAWLTRLDSVLTAVNAANSDRRQSAGGGNGKARPVTLHLYLWDRSELQLLRGLLERHLPDLELQPAIGRLLRLVSPRGALPDPEVLRTSLGTLVSDVVASLFALPIPYTYDLASVSARLQPSAGAWTHHPRTDYSWPLSSQVAFERIHNVWRNRPHRTRQGEQSPEEVRAEIVRTVRSKLAAVDSVIRGVREQTRKAAARNGDRLQLSKEPFFLGGGDPPLQDPTLELLRIFARLESTAEALALRELHLLSPPERARRGECLRDMHLVERRPDGHLVFEFSPECRDAKFRAGEFNLLLTNDDGSSLVELHRKPWQRRKLLVELVEYDLAADPPRAVLAPGTSFAKAEQEGLIDLELVCVLDRAPSDVNTRRIVTTLEAIADGAGEAAFIRGLLHSEVPADWSPPFGGAATADSVWAEVVGAAAEAYQRPVLNPEQEHAWRAAFERPVTLVWGPPGTGKTYLLAWMLIGLAAAAKREGKPCRILVTAATHRALVNVLVRTGRELGGTGIPSPLRLVKLRGSGSEADRDLEGLAVDVLEDSSLPAVLTAAEADGEPVVVGSTVWSLWKQMKANSSAETEDGPDGDQPVRPWFDVVVIDEASQMKVPDALIALSGIRAGGQAILCGDDRQLAPIIRGSYDPEVGTLFGSVFSHFAGHYEKLTLRESRRMNRALVDYPRELFYPGLVSMCPEQRLTVLRPEEEPLDPLDDLLRGLFLAPEDAVVFCTYAGIRTAGRNPFEAQVVARLARLARGCLGDPDTGQHLTPEQFVSQGLAIISPHRAQNSAILSELLRTGFSREELPVVDTVERMQGNEREMVIVSYAVADREYAEAEAEFLLNPNRFNVSITRPRSKLVVLMSEEVLEAFPRDERVLDGSMAIKGYREHCRDDVREAELPGPGGEPVRVRCHYRRLS